MGFKTLSFFCPVLGGPPGEAGSALLRRADRYGVSCRRRTGSSISLVGPPLESGIGPAHIGPCNACHRAAPETTPFIHTRMWQRGFTPPRLAIPREGHVKGINHEHISVPVRRESAKARADALLPSTAKGRHALSSMALGDLSFRVSSSLTPSRVIPADPSHE